jgi:hypothetical protein
MTTDRRLIDYFNTPGAEKAVLLQAMAGLGVAQCSVEHDYSDEQKQLLREQFELPSVDQTIVDGDIITGGSF